MCGECQGIGGFWSENKVWHRPSPTRKVSLIANNIFLDLDSLHKCNGRIYIEKLTAYCGVFYMENSGNLKASKNNELFQPGFLLMMHVHVDLFNLLWWTYKEGKGLAFAINIGKPKTHLTSNVAPHNVCNQWLPIDHPPWHHTQTQSRNSSFSQQCFRILQVTLSPPSN